MTLVQLVKSWSGPPNPNLMMPIPTAEVQELAQAMSRCQEAVRLAFGERQASDPMVIAEFMRADAEAKLALEVKAVREILANGSGAITIGIEKVSD